MSDEQTKADMVVLKDFARWAISNSMFPLNNFQEALVEKAMASGLLDCHEDEPPTFSARLADAVQPAAGEDELRAALERIAELNPNQANAHSAWDLHCTVKAIAKTALADAALSTSVPAGAVGISISGEAEGELHIKVNNALAITVSQNDGTSYATWGGTGWMPGTFDADTEQVQAAAEMQAALTPPAQEPTR